MYVIKGELPNNALGADTSTTPFVMKANKCVYKLERTPGTRGMISIDTAYYLKNSVVVPILNPTFGINTYTGKYVQQSGNALPILSDLVAGNYYPDLYSDFIDQNYKGAAGANTLTTLIDHNSATAGNATMTGGYGPELVTNGGFDSGDLTGWVVDNNDSTHYVEYNNGGARYVSDTTSPLLGFSQVNVLTVGKVYEVSVQTTAYTSGSLKTDSFTVTNVVSDGVGVVVFTGVASSTSLVFVRNTTNVDITIDNISVREIPKVQWRPHNLLKYSEDLSDSDWAKSNTTVTANAAVAPDGTTTADEISHTSTAGEISQTVSNILTNGEVYSVGVYVKYVDHQWFRIYHENGSTWFDILNGTTGTVGADSASITDVGNGWYFCHITNTHNSADTTVLTVFLLADANGSGTETSGTSAYIWGAHLYRSDLGGMADVPAAERVLPDATTYVRTAGRETTGVELVTNGTFDTDTTGWTAYDGATTSVTSGKVTITNNNGNDGIYQGFSTVVGKVYQISAYTENGTSITKTLVGTGAGNGSLLNTLPTNGGNVSGTFVATGTTTYVSLQLDGVAGSTGTFDNVSVKEIDVDPSTARYLPRIGHHVYNGSQWVNEGLLHESEARTNDITYSEDLSNAAWTLETNVTLGTPLSIGGLSLDLIEHNGVANFRNVRQNGPSVSVGDYVTFSAYIKAGTSGETAIRMQDPTNVEKCTVPITWTSGVPSVQTAIETANFPSLSYDVEEVGGGVYRVHLTCQNNTAGAFVPKCFYYVQWDETAAAVNTYAGAFQAEIGSTPSSYIPTSGSTVTRAAETLTIEHENLPWPSPYVIGDELVTNGTFDTDTSGWTVGSGATLSSVSERLNVLTTAPDTLSNAHQAITVTTGNVYIATATKVSQDSNSDWGLSTTATSTRDISNFGSSVTGTKTVIFVAPANTIYFQLWSAGDGVTDATAVYDNISVKEINPLSVSIAMDGRMTYADEGGLSAVTYRWRNTSTEYLGDYLYTTGAETGELNFFQVGNGVTASLAAVSNQYTPDILVPFNTASRHGSTFVNGAVDGVALTANTTVTELPDLETTDLELGYDFMGTIGTFRIWANDIGDDGLVEATEPSDESSLSMSFDGTESSFVNFNWSE